MSDDLELDELFRQARAAMKQERAKAHAAEEARRKRKMDPVEAPIEPLGIYANPENWMEGRGLALIHRETRLLLGNFRELLHKSVPGARRLVRSTTPIAVEGVEEVDFGLPSDTPTFAPMSRAITTRIYSGPLDLSLPEVHCALAEVTVHYYDGATARVVLEQPASFTSEHQLLALPAGVDILPVLTVASKRILRSAP